MTVNVTVLINFVNIKEPINMKLASDADLLVYLSFKFEEREIAGRAWEEFYSRHIDYVYEVCKRYEKTLEDDIVQDTFLNAAKYASSFDDQGLTDPEMLRRRVRKWLSGIAYRVFLAKLDSSIEFSSIVSDLKGRDEKNPGELSEREQRRGQLMAVALKMLSEREQDILLATSEFLNLGGNSRMSNAASAELSRRWKTTNDNVRKIRQRAREKIRKFFLDSGEADII